MRGLPITYKDLVPFVELVVDRPKDTEKVARLCYAILASGSARKSDWARHYRQEATEEANYKAIERLLEGLDPKRFLHRLVDTQHPILLADLTEVHRPQAKRTPYVGRLQDGGRGFWVFTLAQPYKGRAIPVHVGLYSQATLEAEGTSRNRVWRRFLREALEGVEPGSVWVFDREFSFGGWLEVLEEAGVRYAIRLNARGKAYVEDEAGRRIPLRLGRGEWVAWTGVYYRTEGSRWGCRVNVVGVWEAMWEEPLWVMGNLPVEELLAVYRERMKVEESFRDLKSYLGMGNLMNKRRENAEKTLWLLAFAYALGLLIGETLRGRWQRERGGLVGGSGGTTLGYSFS
ncbi:transposase [Thermus thalpophilus]|uniref:transposase n=1 Tax=Thermus thalpophilus TaxID=2908147 RepID=UPI001FA9D3BB|nr:transposase [Thermus thalpophilus]